MSRIWEVELLHQKRTSRLMDPFPAFQYFTLARANARQWSEKDSRGHLQHGRLGEWTAATYFKILIATALASASLYVIRSFGARPLLLSLVLGRKSKKARPSFAGHWSSSYAHERSLYHQFFHGAMKKTLHSKNVPLLRLVLALKCDQIYLLASETAIFDRVSPRPWKSLDS